MAHTYISCRLHIIFSTRKREKTIPRRLRERLWSYLGGIANNLGLKVFAVGGMEEHVHMLIGLSATLCIAEVAQKLKANSSRWMKENGAKGFAWQEGYSAFSISISHMDGTIEYIRNQESHHRKRRFEEELAAILRKHGLSD